MIMRTMSTYSRVRASGFAYSCEYQPSTTCGPLTPRPSMSRPPERWSSVIAVIAVDAGVRAEICVMAVPSFTWVVWLPHHANGVKQSDPYASDVQIESNPSRSAAAICSAASAGGPDEGQYPMIKPSFMTGTISGMFGRD
jgi:hypothetical protein